MDMLPCPLDRLMKVVFAERGSFFLIFSSLCAHFLVIVKFRHLSIIGCCSSRLVGSEKRFFALSAFVITGAMIF